MIGTFMVLSHAIRRRRRRDRRHADVSSFAVMVYLKLSGIEAIEPHARGLGLRIHQEAELSGRSIRAARHRGRSCTPASCVSHEPNSALARGNDLGIVDRQVRRRFFEHDLAHVGGVDRHPAEAGEINLRAAMLRFGDDCRARAEALVAELRWRNANAVDVARRQAGRPRQADIERVEIGAFAAEIARLEHRRDVADAAAAHLGVAERVIDDPLVDRARLLDVGLAFASPTILSEVCFDDAVDRNEFGALRVEFTFRRRKRSGRPGFARSIARSRVAILLVTSTTGLFSPSGHST